MFGNLGGQYRSQNNLADLLQVQSNMEVLLDDDNFISEFKSGSPRIRE